MVGLNFVVRAYIEAQSNVKKSRILQKIFDMYRPLTIKFCKRYNHIEESEVITQHVHIGIVLALRKLDVDLEHTGAIIYRHIQRELHQFIVVPFYRAKCMEGKKVSLDAVDFKLTEKKVLVFEDDIVTRMDIEDAINRLPENKRTLVKLWLSGYNLHEIQNEFPNMKFLSTNSKNIYYHFESTKHMLREHLLSYECA